MVNDPHQLRQMSIFARVVEAGSISKAAEQLQLSKSVISQHLKRLEQELGATLLKRTTRRQQLTAVGQEFYLYCQQLNDFAEQGWRCVQERQSVPQGDVVITAPHALMSSVVVPAIGNLMKQHQDIRPQFIVSDMPLDLMDDNIDLAIRVGASADSNYKQRRIGQFRDVLVASEQYLLTSKLPLEDMRYIANHWQGQVIQHHFIGKRDLEMEKSLMFKAGCTVDSFPSLLALIEQDLGIGLIPELAFNRANSTLVEVLPEYQLKQNSVYALHPYQTLPLVVSSCLTAIEQRMALHTS